MTTEVLPECIAADWHAPSNVRAVTTTRVGGYSKGVYTGFNLAQHVNDLPAAVDKNRQLLQQHLTLPVAPQWLDQVHSHRVVKADTCENHQADASWTDQAGSVCVVLTADCLPVFFCDRAGTRVAIAHAGWKGLHAGVITQTVQALGVAVNDLLVWLGPAIGPNAFEVGDEVRAQFVTKHSANSNAFARKDAAHWNADIYHLARIELENLGVNQIYGGDFCTYSDQARFYSYRRDGDTGRMASLIWIDDH